MKLLLHTCCAPCAVYPILEAKRKNFAASGFFYNPNIHPPFEYERRKKEAEIFFHSENIPLFLPEYDTRDFFKKVSSRAAVLRCPECWFTRLEKSVSFAAENGFDAFTTTLLGSPYQDHGCIRKICAGLSEEKGVEFYYSDYRIGFRDAHRTARQRGMYCQNYCGCVFSIIEREEAKAAKRKEKKTVVAKT